MSRPKRWAAATAKVREGLEELTALQEEYQDWLDGMPEGLEDGPTAEKLTEVCEIDLECITDGMEEAEGADLPRGFGRD